VDFWGTWCGPCREEMPKINEFVQKINGRKDLAFLSIASHDYPTAVTSFLNERQYHLPVCMSDNEIDGKFGVTGYPGKFLISPTGSVQPIDFGKDWAKIVDQISALKPKQTKPDRQPSKLQNQKKN
jgi:thiol-disulfide isomerase/thioredoxin